MSSGLHASVSRMPGVFMLIITIAQSHDIVPGWTAFRRVPKKYGLKLIMNFLALDLIKGGALIMGQRPNLGRQNHHHRQLFPN